MFIAVKASRFGRVERKEEDIHPATHSIPPHESILPVHITMYAKTLLVALFLAIVIYTLTRPHEGMCAASAKLTAVAIEKACADQNGVYDAATNTCNCPNGTA